MESGTIIGQLVLDLRFQRRQLISTQPNADGCQFDKGARYWPRACHIRLLYGDPSLILLNSRSVKCRAQYRCGLIRSDPKISFRRNVLPCSLKGKLLQHYRHPMGRTKR